MSTILDDIVAYKREFIDECKRRIPLESLNAPAAGESAETDFKTALQKSNGIGVIAEIKKASPSKGIIREDLEPVEIAGIYETNGARAISVLTDERYFQGSACTLTQVRQVTELPILRKDFIIDPYQIYEARAIGANAVLLIVRILSTQQLRDYLDLSHGLSLDALVEVHTQEEIEIALSVNAPIIGINNRDLRTFQTDLNVTEKLIGGLKEDTIAVSESGIYTRRDVERLQEAGANAVLVGEGLMREPDIGKKLRELLGHGKG